MKIIDLSFPIRPHFRWSVAREIRSSHARGDNFESSVMTLACHAYTHVDAPPALPARRPLHHRHADRPVDRGRRGGRSHPPRRQRRGHGRRSGGRAGHVRAGDIALLRTDWPLRTSVDDERFWRDAPYTGRERLPVAGGAWRQGGGLRLSARLCCPHIDLREGRPIPREDNTTHYIFFPAGITVIEYLTNLDQIGAPRCRFLALPLKLEGADGSPVRAIAWVE